MQVTCFEGLKKLKGTSYWADRIIAQLEYVMALSRIDGAGQELVQSTIDWLAKAVSAEGAITKNTTLQGEAKLAPLGKRAKELTLICVAHAHIDMNWMWRWDETVTITLDTFRTMLNLMEEFPGFTFAQSQASVYRIVEEYAPEMLPQIKQRIHEGRWEVTASTWVETDKNMPNGESLARHILYTKDYLSKLLEISPDSLTLDFEPDTFGHSVNVPEILAEGGVKYYYHCRGADVPSLYRWYAPSGRSIIVCREPHWYNDGITPDIILSVPEFCNTNKIGSMLKVYGVGDHGGGPTRRDLTTILDMQNWPICPTIKFGTYGEYFAEVEKIADVLPRVDGELNFVFSGCYTSQTRIKRANRVAERALQDGELYSTGASLLTDTPYPAAGYAEAWQNVLFNQFHDILPGSGTVDTREHALGLFQNTMATAVTNTQRALTTIARHIDTSVFAVEDEIAGTRAEGAGVGFGIGEFKVGQLSRGTGKTRVFTVFNSALRRRTELAEVVIWDWLGDPQKMEFADEHGNRAGHQVLDHSLNRYWGHQYTKVLLQVDIPPCGYKTYVLRSADSVTARVSYPDDPRFDRAISYVLENDKVKAEFDPTSMALISLTHRQTGEELIDGNTNGALFRFIQEDDNLGMTSWRVGRYKIIADIDQASLKSVHMGQDSLRQWIKYSLSFSHSEMEVTVSLDRHSSRLDYSVECHWREIGVAKEGIPQLNFNLPLGYPCDSYKYDVPFGTVIRPALPMDVPANSWAQPMAPETNKNSLLVVTDSKYGFRGDNNGVGISLIRSSFDPDPYPEVGVHKFGFAIAVIPREISNKVIIEYASDYNHALTPISTTIQSGKLGRESSIISLVRGSVGVSAIKGTENGDQGSFLVRVYETDGKDTEVVLDCYRQPQEAYFVDLNEMPLVAAPQVEISGRRVSFPVNSHRIATVCIAF